MNFFSVSDSDISNILRQIRDVIFSSQNRKSISTIFWNFETKFLSLIPFLLRDKFSYQI